MDSALVPVPGGPTQTSKGVTGFRWGTSAPLPQRLGISYCIMSYHIMYHIVSSITSYYLLYHIPYHSLSLHHLCCEWVLRDHTRQDPVPNLLRSGLHSPSFASSQLPGLQLPSGHKTIPAGALQEEEEVAVDQAQPKDTGSLAEARQVGARRRSSDLHSIGAGAQAQCHRARTGLASAL